jgi:biopolymer transport protein ExbB
MAADVSVDLGKAIQETRDNIEQTTLELNRMRKKVTAARKPLVREIRFLEEEVATLRKKVDRHHTFQREKGSAFTAFREEGTFLESEVEFVASVSSEYRREMETRAGVAEAQRLSEGLEEVDRLLAGEGSAALKAIHPLLALAADHNRDNLGGHRFQGFCLDEEGIRHRGTFALFGPITYFAADEGALAGLVVTRLGSTEPSVVTGLDPDGEAQIKALTEGKEAAPHLDVTLGDVFKIRAARESGFEQIKKGGIVMIPILGLGVVCVVLVIWKFISLSTLRTEVGPALDKILALLRGDKSDQAEELARALGEPLSPVILEGIEHRHAPREHIEEIMHERIAGEIPMLEQHLAVLAVCAAAAPLLGLLGTVTGMMHTFKLITIFGTGEARLMSGGISEALITTQYGLMIAVPTLLAHAYLSRRVRRIIGALEQTAIGFINGIKVRGQ